MRKRTRHAKGFFSWQQITGALIGCGAAIVGMAALSLLLYGGIVGDGAIGPVNGVLKVLCPFLAGFFAVSRTTARPSFSGGIAGAAYWVLTTLVLCFFLGQAPVSWAILGDFVISLATGMAGGMVRGLLLEHKK